MEITQKKYGNIEVDTSESDAVTLIMSEKRINGKGSKLINKCNVIILERSQIKALIQVLMKELTY